MANSFSGLSVGHAYAPNAYVEDNLNFYQKLELFYQKLEREVDYILALDLDWRAVGIATAMAMAIFITLLIVMFADSKKPGHIDAIKKSLPKME